MKRIITIALLFLTVTVDAQSLKNGFEALNAGLYPVARREFSKILEKDTLNPAANYGLGVLYFKNDFMDRNPDSANYFTMRGIRSLNQPLKPSELSKYEEYGARANNFNDLLARINDRGFQIADSLNTVDAWEHFMSTYTTSPKLNDALQLRNKRAYEDAKANYNYQSFEDFMKKYPNSAEMPDAKKEYEYLLYHTKTKDSTYRVYKQFMDDYPQSPYDSDANVHYEILLYNSLTASHTLDAYDDFAKKYPENKYTHIAVDSVYYIFTRPNTLEILRAFIRQYPTNPHINEAWLRIYDLSIPVMSIEALQNFAAKNPKFPDAKLLQHDMMLAKRCMKLIQIDSLYGYEDSVTCDTFIKPQFTQANEFSEGLAVVSTGKCNTDTSGNIINCPYGYINEEGKYVIQPNYSQAYNFKKGIALASDGMCKDSCHFGFINRFGKWAIKPIYTDAYDFNCGRALVRTPGSKYGYLNHSGDMAIAARFDDALSFSMCKAGVKVNKKWGFIDTIGNIVIDTMFNEVGIFSDSLAAASDSTGAWGYIDMSGKWQIKPQFTSADAFQDGKATVMVEKAVRVRGNKKVKLGGERIIDTTGKFVDERKPASPYKHP